MEVNRLMVRACTILISHEFLKLYKIDEIIYRISIKKCPSTEGIKGNASFASMCIVVLQEVEVKD